MFSPISVISKGKFKLALETIWTSRKTTAKFKIEKPNVFYNTNLQNEQQQLKTTHRIEIQKSKTPQLTNNFDQSDLNLGEPR